MIDEKKLLDRLKKIEEKHRGYADKPGVLNQYQEGFADGVQQAMNEIVSLLDEERLK